MTEESVTPSPTPDRTPSAYRLRLLSHAVKLACVAVVVLIAIPYVQSVDPLKAAGSPQATDFTGAGALTGALAALWAAAPALLWLITWTCAAASVVTLLAASWSLIAAHRASRTASD